MDTGNDTEPTSGPETQASESSRRAVNCELCQGLRAGDKYVRLTKPSSNRIGVLARKWQAAAGVHFLLALSRIFLDRQALPFQRAKTTPRDRFFRL